MKLHVRYFANIRDLIGKDSERVNVGVGATAEGVWNRITDGSGIPKNILIAVNHEYVSAKHVLKDGDELAFFPPVTGG